MAADYRGRSDWVTVLSPAHVAELDAAIAGVLASGIDVRSQLHRVGRDQFPLPTLGPVLEAVRQEVVAGRGFALIRSFPVDRWGGGFEGDSGAGGGAPSRKGEPNTTGGAGPAQSCSFMRAP